MDAQEIVFQCLDGNLTAEQIQQLQQMKNLTTELLESTYVDDEQGIQTVHIVVENPAEPATSSELEVQPIDPNDELTIKYIHGIISFEQFMKEHSMFNKREDADQTIEMEEAEDNEEVEMEQEEEPKPSTSGQNEAVVKQEEPPVKKRKKRPKKMHSRLAKDLQGLMGEANLMYARGQHMEAIKMCMEVVRLAPTAPEPFQTLAMLYDEIGDTEKSMQFLLIAAHLMPSNAEQWMRLAEMAVDFNKLKDAITYLSKAIKAEPGNIDLIFERSSLHRHLDEKDKAIDGYIQILKLLPVDAADRYIQLVRDTAKLAHEIDKNDLAIQIIENAFEERPACITSEDVNLLVELHMSQKEYVKPVQVIVQNCGIKLKLLRDEEIEGQTARDIFETKELRENIKSVIVPEMMPIDLQVKLVVCLIHLKMDEIVQVLVAPLFELSAEEYGDLFLDVSEAYMEEDQFKEAKPILATLVNSQTYNLAAVWNTYGECLNAMGELQNAAEAFKHVVELAPIHFNARVQLSTIQQRLGKPEEALNALTQDISKPQEIIGQDIRLLHQRCLLLHSQGKYSEFLELAKKMLFSHFKEILNPQHIAVVLSYRTQKHRSLALRQMLGSDVHSVLKDAPCFDGTNALPLDDVWELYLKVCNTLCDLDRYQEFEELAITALTVPQFMDDSSKSKEAEFICLISFILNKNGNYAFNFVKEYCMKEIDNNRAWNLFNQVIHISDHQRHNRFLMRYMLKATDNLPLGILNGHQSMINGNYKYALAEYIAAYRRIPKDPLISLCIGLSFIYLASAKFSMRRHFLVIQGCAFLNQYMQLRGECQESCFNLGRAMHQLSLFHAAVYFYEKGLTLSPCIEGEDGVFDLTKELAFNLCRIYQSSNSDDMARMIMEKYLVV
ncbi:general transcription factor 3C polypeptide 3-like [Tubulanus polymorphus]|uniref:general transcription factor 3C polypeptide 3-like n=1 Tax=Tubulanus polymorphus TaxID=672921 RepID=UPI003DA25EB6